MYICMYVCMYVGEVTYPAVPFALDLEDGAGRSKSLRILSEPKEGHGARGYGAGLHVCMNVCMYVCI